MLALHPAAFRHRGSAGGLCNDDFPTPPRPIFVDCELPFLQLVPGRSGVSTGKGGFAACHPAFWFSLASNHIAVCLLVVILYSRITTCPGPILFES